MNKDRAEQIAGTVGLHGANAFRIGQVVNTPDGVGVVIGMSASSRTENGVSFMYEVQVSESEDSIAEWDGFDEEQAGLYYHHQLSVVH